MAGVQPTGFLAKRKRTKKDACFGTFSPILDKEQGGFKDTLPFPLFFPSFIAIVLIIPEGILAW